jgi:hypothetical protein
MTAEIDQIGEMHAMAIGMIEDVLDLPCRAAILRMDDDIDDRPRLEGGREALVVDDDLRPCVDGDDRLGEGRDRPLHLPFLPDHPLDRVEILRLALDRPSYLLTGDIQEGRAPTEPVVIAEPTPEAHQYHHDSSSISSGYQGQESGRSQWDCRKVPGRSSTKWCVLPSLSLPRTKRREERGSPTTELIVNGRVSLQDRNRSTDWAERVAARRSGRN